jgi:hypothetical protein
VLEVLAMPTKLLDYLENQWVAIIVSIIFLIVFNLFLPKYWSYVFSILLAYLITEVIAQLFISGRRGIVQFPLLGNETQPKGHGYLVFIIFIIVATILSSYFTDQIAGYLKNISNIYQIVISNIIIAILVFVDFELTFYSK